MSQAPQTRLRTFKVRRPRWPGGRSATDGRSSADAPERLAEPERPAKSPAPPATGGDSVKPDRAARVARLDAASGQGFARLTVIPAIALIAWLVPGLALLLAGDFAPVPVLLISAPLAAALAVNVLHRIPDRWPAEPGTVAERAWMPLAGLMGTAAVAAVFMFWQLALGSASVLAARTPGAFFQAGYWIAQHGSLRISGSLAAFGTPGTAVHLSSAGFFQVGGSVVPGVLAGLPMLLAAGFWTSGVGGGAVVGPVLGGLAVLSFGGLVGRLAGRAWAPAGALALAVTLPEIYTSRDAFSEPAVQVLLFGGLSLVIDALTLREPATPREPAAPREPAGLRRFRFRFMAAITAERMLAGTGGLAIGLTSLLGLASLPLAVPAIVAAGVVIAVRRVAGIAFGVGLCIGLGCGLIAGYVLARPLMDARSPTLEVIGLDAAIAAALVAVAFAVLRTKRVRGALSQRSASGGAAARPARSPALPARAVRAALSWLPTVGAVVVAAAVAGLLARPLLQTVRGTLGAADTRYVGLLQQAAGLRLDPTRLYSEDSLYWVIWYAGLPAVLLGGFGAAVVVRRCLRSALNRSDPSGAALNWALPLTIMLGGAAAVLWQPFTVPDQPWASRRLVPVVLPAVIVFAIWAAAWLVRLARERGARAPTGVAVGALCVAAILLPALSTSFGVGFAHTGVGGGLRTSTGGLAQHRVGSGQTQAVQALCGALGRSASVLIVDPRVTDEFAPAIRGICGVPVAWTAPRNVQAVVAGILRAGRHPVILGARAAEVARYGNPVTLVLRLETTQYPHVLTQPPGGPRPARYEVWMVTPTTLGAGV